LLFQILYKILEYFKFDLIDFLLVRSLIDFLNYRARARAHIGSQLRGGKGELFRVRRDLRRCRRAL